MQLTITLSDIWGIIYAVIVGGAFTWLFIQTSKSIKS